MLYLLSKPCNQFSNVLPFLGTVDIGSGFLVSLLKADSNVAGDQIRIRRTTNCLIFMKKKNLLLVNSGTCTVRTMQNDFDSIDNFLFFMLHELVFLGYHFHFASYPYSFASYSYTVVKFCNHTLRLQYGCIPIQYHRSPVLLSENSHEK